MRFTAVTFKRRIEQELPRSPMGSEPRGGDSSASSVVDLSELLLIRDDEEFLREAYRCVLRRECDIPGFLHYREMLRNHVPRKAILRCLVNSEEGRQTGFEYIGLQGQGWDSAGLRFRVQVWVSSALQRLLGRALWLHRVLLLRPLELLERKVDYLFHELGARSDQFSAKIDAYAGQLRAELEEATQREVILLQRVEDTQRVQAQQVETCAAELRAVLESLAQREVVVDQRFQEHQERQATTALALAQLRGELDAFSVRTSSALSELRQRLTEDLSPPVIRAGENVLVTELDGFILGVPGEEWRLVAHLAFRGALEPGLLRVFRSLIKPGMVVADVGAHIGIFTLEAARLLAGRGQVYSFEPTPRTFAILRDNVQVNGFLESGIVVLRKAAVSDTQALATLGVYPENSGHNTLFPGSDCPASVEVQTTTLDEALATETHVDVVKIDAEGAEPLILRGMDRIIGSNPEIRILMEFAPVHLRRAGIEPGAFVEEIQSMSFQIARVHDTTGEPLPVSKEELLTACSLNLLLAHGGAPAGGAA